MAQTRNHCAVLLSEAVAALQVRPEGCYVDATYGRGGHAQGILERLGGGRLLVIDRDPEAIAAAWARHGDDPRVLIEQGGFSHLAHCCAMHGLVGTVDGVLLDLGVSSPQLEDPARGFSFSHDGPLDMRMDPAAGPSVADWLARASRDEIVRVLRRYGEERYAKRIAEAIVAVRQEVPLVRTGQLADLVRSAKPAHDNGKHPATQVFQALRIFINGELAELEACLPQAVQVLSTGGRLVVISFHSLEDRMVKRFLRRLARGGDVPAGLPLREAELKPTLRLGAKVVPNARETEGNPRARSAVMRVAERL